MLQLTNKKTKDFLLHKIRKPWRRGFFQNKKGISIMIGYVLLITFAIVMGGIVYQWMKTYVPQDSLECPEGVSVFAKSAIFDCENNILNLTLKNNGRFNIAGFFIHATNSSSQELATIDISQNLTQGGSKVGNAVLYALGNENSIETGKEIKTVFQLDQRIYAVQITPVRFQDVEKRIRMVTCGDAKIEEKILYCGGEGCTPDCTGKTCGDDGCGGSCGTCSAGYNCSNGICVEEACVPVSNSTTCGTWVCGSKLNNCGQNISCGTCLIGYTCSSGVCIAQGGGLLDGLILYYPFSEGSGSIVNDNSGNNNDGTVGGTYSWVIGHGGASNSALQFDGAPSTGITTAKTSSLKSITSQITISFWMKNLDLEGENEFILTDLDSAYSQESIWVANGYNNQLEFVLVNTSNGYAYYEFNDEIRTIGEWNHVVIVYNGTRAYGYINGYKDSKGSLPLTGNLYINTSYNVPLYTGRYQNSAGDPGFNGVVDDVAIWNRALTDAEITEIYNNGI